MGGYGADRWGYRRSLLISFAVLTLLLLSFSLLAPMAAGSLFATVGVGTALVFWSISGWSQSPFQQYRLIELSPEQSNLVLSLNASAIYLGQGAGAAIGALVLLYGSLGSLGWVAALRAATGVVVLILGIPPAKQTRP